MYKVVISVRLFVCPIITQESLDRFASNLYRVNSGEPRDVLSSVFSFFTLIGKNTLIRI